MTSLLNPHVVQTAAHIGLVQDLLTHLHIRMDGLCNQEQSFRVNHKNEFPVVYMFKVVYIDKHVIL